MQGFRVNAATASVVPRVALDGQLPDLPRSAKESEEEQQPHQPLILGLPSSAAEGTEVNQLSSAEGHRGPVPVARVAPAKFKIMYTCKVCEHRNSHMISRLAYNQGIVIVTCAGCNSRHLISDKTGLLDYGVFNVEMLAASGESVTRLGVEGYRRVLDSVDTTEAPKPANNDTQLLIRNQNGIIEALDESTVSTSSAASFLADS